MSGGGQKAPGDFRRSQNWIGGAGLNDAVFIPPAHDEVPELMSDLEKFWHNDQVEVPHLIRIAISHYQFETIHPFLDGNGRIGRLLITLYLVDKKLLAKPSLYLSDHLERHKAAYYDALTRVRTTHDLAHWIKFFLVAVRDTATKGVNTFRSVLELRSEMEPRILKLGKRSGNAHLLLQFLYRKPFVSYRDIAESLHVSPPTAIALARDFIRLKILKETTGYERNRLYVFDRYYRLFTE